MKYNQYIATNFVQGAIQNTNPHPTVAGAMKEFFTEHKHMHVCSIKRVCVKPSGEVLTDPEFKMRRVDKNTA